MGPPVSLEHGWDITNHKHQAAICQLLKKHTPKLVVMASATRPWGSSLPRTDKDVRAWLTQREKEHIPLMARVLKEQKQNQREALIEMPLGTWMLELPEIKELKSECYGCDVQLTDFLRIRS